MNKKLQIGFAVAALLVFAPGVARSAAIVKYTAAMGTGGEFRYNLTLDNTLGSEALSGFLVVNGSSVFGLDLSSLVGSPPNWDSMAPVPFIVDPLSFFSLDPTADFQPGSFLSGFFFQSLRGPATIGPGDFQIIAINSATSEQIP